MIVSPSNGTFFTAGAILVEGLLINVAEEDIADVRLNGVSVLPLTSGVMFSGTVFLDASNPVNPIVAEVIGHGGTVLRDRITVVVGDSIVDGSFSQEGIAVRLSEAGLDDLESPVSSAVPLDLASLVPPGTLIVDNYCYQDSIFGCIGRIDATISGNPPPSAGDLVVDVDPMTNFVASDITLSDLFFQADVVAVTGIGFSCDIDVTASTTTIFGDYGLSPSAVDPEQIDVTQLGNVNVVFGAFNDSTDCSGFLGGIVEFFIDLFISDLQNDFVRPALEDFLNAVDGEGNTPVASAMELTLAPAELSGPVGQQVGVILEAPIFDIVEDTGGITLYSDSRITASTPNPLAADLTESFHVDQVPPIFGSVSPSGAPFDLGVSVSASSFNQLLKAEIESGLLIISVTEFDFGSGLETITAGLLAGLVPAFSLLDPTELLRIDLQARVAPIVIGAPGPAGELGTLEAPHLDITIVPIADPATILLRVVADAIVGLDAGLNGGQLDIVLSPPAPAGIRVNVLENALFADAASIGLLTSEVVTLALPTLSGSLSSFPLPNFDPFQLGLVDVDRDGQFISLFFDLSLAP